MKGCIISILCLLTAAVPGFSQSWVDCSATLLAGKVQTGGYSSGISGVRCNRLNGDLYMNCVENGIWKSADKGETWARVDNNTVGGRLETGWGMDQDQNNPIRMAVFSLDGSAGLTIDGTTWRAMTTIGRNWDYGSVDWAVTQPKTIFACSHEAGGLLYVSTNGGVNWTVLSVTVNPGSALANDGLVGVMDSTTLVYSNGVNGIQRSTDLGSTWTQVSTTNPRTRTPTYFNGKHYLGGATGLLVSTNKGATWQSQGASVNVCQGPFFGANENIMVVVGTGGIYGTSNGGTNWTKISDLKSNVDPSYQLSMPYYWSTYAWDAFNKCAYATAMANHGFRIDLPGFPTPTSVVNAGLSQNAAEKISVVNSVVRSSVRFSKIEVFSLSGTLLSANSFAPAYTAPLPGSAAGSQAPIIVRVSTEQGSFQRVCR